MTKEDDPIKGVVDMEQAKSIVISALSDRREEIMAFRAFFQAIKMGASAQIIKEARELRLQNRGEIQLEAYFCQISDTITVYDHGDELVADGKLIGVRGFNVTFTTEGYMFDCFILDGGGSRVFYDRKDDTEKGIFMENHVQRLRRGLKHRIEKPAHPPFYSALINEQHDAYTVERIALIG